MLSLVFGGVVALLEQPGRHRGQGPRVAARLPEANNEQAPR